MCLFRRGLGELMTTGLIETTSQKITAELPPPGYGHEGAPIVNIKQWIALSEQLTIIWPILRDTVGWCITLSILSFKTICVSMSLGCGTIRHMPWPSGLINIYWGWIVYCLYDVMNFAFCIPTISYIFIFAVILGHILRRSWVFQLPLPQLYGS